MHLRVMEFNPYLVVDKYGVNIQPNSEFTVLILCTSLILLKYESKQTKSEILHDRRRMKHFEE